jgi:hypothetical protein
MPIRTLAELLEISEAEVWAKFAELIEGKSKKND